MNTAVNTVLISDEWKQAVTSELRGCVNTAVNTVFTDEWKQAVTSELRSSVWKSRWPSWAPVPNKPTVSVDVKQHPTNQAVIGELAWPSGKALGW